MEKNNLVQKSKTPIDIIIVNYYSTDYLLKCLDSIYYSLDGLCANVSVIDNGSKDGLNRINGNFPDVCVNINSINIGFAAAANKVIKQSRSPYVVLLNPDSFVVKGFFQTVLEYMEKKKDVGILGPKILNEDGTIQHSARSFPSPLTGLFGRTTLFSRLFPDNSITRRNLLSKKCDGVTPMEVDWVSGACMILKREALEDVGFMDERFFLYCEDADWCKRMWLKGWKVIYFPQSSIIHHVGISSKKRPLQTTLCFHRSSYYLFLKYSKWPMKLFTPVVFMGLAIRFYFICFKQLFLSLLANSKDNSKTEKQRNPLP